MSFILGKQKKKTQMIHLHKYFSKNHTHATPTLNFNWKIKQQKPKSITSKRETLYETKVVKEKKNLSCQPHIIKYANWSWMLE